MDQVLYKARASWRSLLMIRRVLAALIADAALAGIAYLLHTQSVLEDVWLVLVLLSGIALSIVVVRLMRDSSVYTITTSGVTAEEGFPVRTNSTTMSHSKIQIIDVRQTLFEKLVLKTGDVRLDTAGGNPTGDEIVIRAVANPQRLAGMIREAESQGMRVSWDDPNHGRPSWDRPVPPSNPGGYPQGRPSYENPAQPPAQPPYDPYGQGGQQPPPPWQ